MSEQVQYVAILKDDQFLGGLQKMASQGNATWGKLNSLQDQYQAEVNASAAATDKMNTRMRNLNSTGSTLGTTFSALFAGFSIFTLFQVGKSSLAEFDAQAKANAQTMSVLKSTNNAAGRSLQEIVDQSTKLSQTTLFTDDQVQSAQNLMLTFKDVKGEVFDAAIPTLLDVSTAMDQGLKETAIQVGKALNDPIQGLAALRRVGIQFTDSQENQIKTLVESGRMMEAQSIILGELQSQFGGSAEAAASAGAGGLQQYGKRIGEIKESLGGLINQGINSLMPMFNSLALVLENVVGWMNENSKLVGLLVTYLGSFLGAVLLVVGAIKIWTAVQWLLNTAMTANPIGAIIVGIMTLIGVVIYLWNKFEGFRGFLVGLWSSFKAVFMNLKELAGNVLGGIGELLIGVFTFDKEKIMSGFAKLKSGFVEYGQKVGESFKEGYQQGVDMKGEKTEGTPVVGAGFDPNNPTGDPNATGGGSASSQIGSFSGSENRKTINITVGSLVQKLEFNATNVNQSLDDMAEEVKRVLLSVVNNANMIPG